MTSLQAVDCIQHHLGRIQSSVLSRPSIGLYLCDTDRQDVALFHLRQAGEILSVCPEAAQHLALSKEDADWFCSFYRMTAEELDNIDHSLLWKQMYALVPRVA